MARINIEDGLFKDSRFFELSIRTGSMQNALGCIVWAFTVAQKYYLNMDSDRLIPLVDWKRQGCSDLLITVELAEVRGGGVYVCGSEEQFSWLVQRVEAGRKGGLSGRAINAALSEEDKLKREKARKAIGNAVFRGRIEKPECCQHCGKYGSAIEAHHSDYDKPFDVTWVCKKCHHVLHDMLASEGGKRSVTSVKRVEAVAKPLISTLLYSTQSLKKEEEERATSPAPAPAPDTSATIKEIIGFGNSILPLSNVDQFLSGVSVKAQHSWLEALFYPQDWLEDQIRQCYSTLTGKEPKTTITAFYNTYLQIAWARDRDALIQKQKQKTIDAKEQEEFEKDDARVKEEYAKMMREFENECR